MRSRLLLALLLILSISRDIRADTETRSRFEREYPSAVKRLEDQYAQAKGSYRKHVTLAKGRNSVPREHGTFAFGHGYEKVSLYRSSQYQGNLISSQTVFCVNDSTAFQITRASDRDQWKVEGVGSTPMEKTKFNLIFGRFSKAHFSVNGIPMTKFMDSPSFRVLDAESFEKDKKNFVKVNCERTGKLKESVTIVFDPSEGWVIRSTEWRLGGVSASEVATRFEIDYDVPVNNFWPPKRVTISEGKSEVTQVDFAEWSFDPTALDEFKMPSHGLPDLVVAKTSSGSTLPFWLGGLSLTGFAFAVLIRLLTRSAVTKQRA